MSFVYIALFLPWILFLVSLLGLVLFQGHFIGYLICLELLLLSSNLNFALFSVVLDDAFGFSASLIRLASAASESALGLALLVAYQRRKGTVFITSPKLKGLL